MIIKELIRRGTNHKNFCEDAVYSQVSNGVTYLAVFDGCSTGEKSHFASELMSKLFKRAVNYFELKNRETKMDMTAEEIMKGVFIDFFTFLQTSKSILDVSVDEILSTLVLSVVKRYEYPDNLRLEKDTNEIIYNDKKVEYDVCVALSGDGAYFIEGKLNVIDSAENKPDYISYHLNEGIGDAWRTMKIFNHTVKDISNFAVMSDGIESFKILNPETNINNWLTEEEEKFMIDKLLIDDKLIKSDAMLPRKMNILEKEGYNHFDDLSIIRIIKDEVVQE